MIKTILTPIDGSKNAQSALELSADLAAKYDARLLLLHVGMRDGDVPEELYEAAARELQDAEDSGEETGIYPHPSRHLRILEYLGHLLLRDAQQYAEANGAKRAETLLDFGDTGERILHHAKHESADLIVMGSRGLNELEGLFLGSVSHKVVHLAPCSCVTVRGFETEDAFEGIKTVLVPTDGSDHAAKALDLASDVSAKYGAKLILLYAARSDASLDRLRATVDVAELSAATREELDADRLAPVVPFGGAYIPPAVSDEALREIGEQILARGRKAAEKKGVVKLEVVLAEDDPARAILKTAESQQADLIVMGSRGLGEVTGFLAGSVSYKVNHAAPCSCLVVR